MSNNNNRTYIILPCHEEVIKQTILISLSGLLICSVIFTFYVLYRLYKYTIVVDEFTFKNDELKIDLHDLKNHNKRLKIKIDIYKKDIINKINK
jgi:hypothetical protein